MYNLADTYYAISDLTKRTVIRLGENYVLYLSEPDPEDPDNMILFSGMTEPALNSCQWLRRNLIFPVDT